MGQVAVGQWAWRVKPAVCMCGTVAGEAAAVDLAAALPDVRALLALVPLVWVAAARARVPAGALCLGADGAAATARMAPAAVAAARPRVQPRPHERSARRRSVAGKGTAQRTQRKVELRALQHHHNLLVHQDAVDCRGRGTVRCSG